MPDDASPDQLRAVRDDLRYLVEAYGPNVPASAQKLESLYAGAEMAVQSGEASKLRDSALGIAGALLEGALYSETSAVRGELRASGTRSPKDIPLAKPEKGPEHDALLQLRGGVVGALFGAPALLCTGTIDREAGRAFAARFLAALRAWKSLPEATKETILRDWIENGPKELPINS